MKTLEQLKKKELIKLITEVRPKADAYDRVCETLGIENNILTFVKNLDIQCVSKRSELLFAFITWYADKFEMKFTDEYKTKLVDEFKSKL